MPARQRKNREPTQRARTPLSEGVDLAPENERLKQELETCRQRCEKIEREVGQILHDGVCQELSAAAFYLQCLRNQLDRNRPERIPMLIEQLSASVKKSVESAHTLSQRLREPRV